MNKTAAYIIVAIAYLIYFVMRYATKREEENIAINFLLNIYFVFTTMLLGMTLVL